MDGLENKNNIFKRLMNIYQKDGWTVILPNDTHMFFYLLGLDLDRASGREWHFKRFH